MKLSRQLLKKSVVALLVTSQFTPLFSPVVAAASSANADSSQTKQAEENLDVPKEQDSSEAIESQSDTDSDSQSPEVLEKKKESEEQDARTAEEVESVEKTEEEEAELPVESESEEAETTEIPEVKDSSETTDEQEAVPAPKEETEEDQSGEQEEITEYFSLEENRDKAMEMMESESASQSRMRMRVMSVPRTTAFIEAVSSYAVSVANEHNLYASVMIAQAALESAWGTSLLASPSTYNLFGIKAGANEPYFTKYSKEYSEEEGWTIEPSNFKVYSGYEETFQDYAKKLRRGPDWNRPNGSWAPDYYKGAWKENAKTYKDATKALTGKYATDPNYHVKLNEIIETYNLARFDTKDSSQDNGDELESELKDIIYDEVVSSQKINSYNAYITGKTDGIYTEPKGTKGAEAVADTNQYFNKRVKVTHEAKTSSGKTWVKITLGNNVLGWIEKSGISRHEPILSEKSVNYWAQIIRGTDGINTRPYGTEGYKTVGYTSDYLNKRVHVTKEALTGRTTWALISYNGKELGWVDKNGLDVERILSEKNVNYVRTVARKSDGFNTKPFGTEGYATRFYSSDFYGQRVRIKKEAVTQRATWGLAYTMDGKELGWIDLKGLSNHEVVISEKPIKYRAKIARGTDGINTRPYGTEGYKTVGYTSEYLGKEVEITREAVTDRATWALITYNGNVLGWVDKDALDIERVLSERDVNYVRSVARKSDGFNTKPFGTEGYETRYYSKDLYGQRVRIRKEATTRRATWGLAYTMDGKELGWIDLNGLSEQEIVISEKPIQYRAIVKRGTDGINTRPYGTEGYKTVGSTSNLVGKEVRITREAVTGRATWALITHNGNELGWVDKDALDIERVLSERDVDYVRSVARKSDGFNTRPFGTEGYETRYYSKDFYGQRVRIKKEAETRRATWGLAYTMGGKELGWIDLSALSEYEIILSEKSVNYRAVVNRGTDGINSRPYGTEGYKTLDYTSSILNEEVTVTKEAVTDRATWALISLNGVQLGWVDKSGLKEPQESKVVFIDAGHGSWDSGASYSGTHEKDLNLSVSKKLKNRLEQMGYTVLMTRESDVNLTLLERAAKANKANPDIFISMHHNALPGNTTVTGIETFYYRYNPNYPPAINPIYHNDPTRLAESKKLADLVQKSMIDKTGANDRGVKRETFAVLRETKMPAILIELGFMSSPVELAKLRSDSYQNTLADAIAQGVDKYFN